MATAALEAIVGTGEASVPLELVALSGQGQKAWAALPYAQASLAAQALIYLLAAVRRARGARALLVGALIALVSSLFFFDLTEGYTANVSLDIAAIFTFLPSWAALALFAGLTMAGKPASNGLRWLFHSVFAALALANGWWLAGMVEAAN